MKSHISHTQRKSTTLSTKRTQSAQRDINT
jgi:hypothetical protein